MLFRKKRPGVKKHAALIQKIHTMILHALPKYSSAERGFLPGECPGAQAPEGSVLEIKIYFHFLTSKITYFTFLAIIRYNARYKANFSLQLQSKGVSMFENRAWLKTLFAP